MMPDGLEDVSNTPRWYKGLSISVTLMLKAERPWVRALTGILSIVWWIRCLLS